MKRIESHQRVADFVDLRDENVRSRSSCETRDERIRQVSSHEAEVKEGHYQLNFKAYEQFNLNGL